MKLTKPEGKMQPSATECYPRCLAHWGWPRCPAASPPGQDTRCSPQRAATTSDNKVHGAVVQWTHRSDSEVVVCVEIGAGADHVLDDIAKLLVRFQAQLFIPRLRITCKQETLKA